MGSITCYDSQALIRGEYVILGSRILTEFLQAFKPLASVVINHIPHRYSAEMSNPSTHVCINFAHIKSEFWPTFSLGNLNTNSTLEYRFDLYLLVAQV